VYDVPCIILYSATLTDPKFVFTSFIAATNVLVAVVLRLLLSPTVDLSAFPDIS
jgi:hypothetical protein